MITLFKLSDLSQTYAYIFFVLSLLVVCFMIKYLVGQHDKKRNI